MTKEEKIQEAYGEYWEQLNPLTKGRALSNNGWLHYDDITDNRGTLINCIDMEGDIDYYRPKSLQGIEDNNGWVKIESENDLPKETIECDFIFENDIYRGWYNMILFNGRLKPNSVVINFASDVITHYQPIVKPKPPVY